jgi:4-amino-4-deoxy-L-arabinose transferase-like glycosyltransferase
MRRSDIHGRKLLMLAVCCYLFFFLGNGLLSLTNPDEVFYAQTCKEMVQHNSWLTPYMFGAPQFEKPILIYWLGGAAFKAFGVSNYSARLFPALFAALGIFAVYWLGWLGFKDRRAAFISSLVLLSSAFYIGLARTLFTDMIFTVFIALSLLSFYAAYARPRFHTSGILFCCVFAALAVLTKGPLGAALPFLIIFCFLALNRELRFLADRRFIWGSCLFALIALPWYILMINRYGHAFTHEFFYNDHVRRLFEAEHRSNDKWYFYPLSIIGCMFPWCIYVACSLVAFFRKSWRSIPPFSLFLACWIAIVFLAFQFAHSKLTTYIFPLFPALALVAGDFICSAAMKKQRILLRVSLASALMLALAALGLMFAKMPAAFAWAAAPARMLGAVLVVFCLAMAFVIRRKRMLHAAYVLAFACLGILSILPLISARIDPYVASKRAADCLAAYDIRTTIVCSKPFVRGVFYYTDKKVAVFERGKNFFSPHPIPFFASNEALKEFLLTQPVTFCVLNKKSAAEIAGIAGPGFRVATVCVAGNQYVLKVERL